jgi:uncharacterized lipoprotein YajG
MTILKVAAMAAALAVMQGCAFTKATLDVHANPEVRVAGPIQDAAPIQFSVPQLEDARADKVRIGWKKNGLGMNTADIVTAQPVDLIVEHAVTKALTDTQHRVGSDGQVQVVGTVDRFWFEGDANFWTIRFTGEVQCTLDFVDAQTRQSIYKSKYSGSHTEQKAGGYLKTWTIIMNRSLDKLIEGIVLDEELAAALKARAGSQTVNAGAD